MVDHEAIRFLEPAGLKHRDQVQYAVDDISGLFESHFVPEVVIALAVPAEE